MELFSFKFSTLPGMIRTAASLAVFACNEAGLDKMATYAAELAVSEAVTNVVRHAYREGEEGFGLFSAKISDEELVFEVADWGPGYREVVDAARRPESPAESGAGLFLIKEVMDEVTYREERGMNILTMKKKIGPGH